MKTNLSNKMFVNNEQYLFEFNNTKIDYPKEKTIVQLFEEQVQRTPENIALIFGDSELTYLDLNEKANQLARFLRTRGVSSNEVVGIMIDKSLEMIISVLAIVKAGGSYLPIDIDYPENRIEYMLKDSGTKILLTQQESITGIEFNGEIINVYDSKYYDKDKSNPEWVNKPNDLIYIIYTSGSTGKPKGVMIEHENVNNLVSNSNLLIFDANDRILQTGSIAFDASTFEIWGALLNGARLYLIEKNELLSAKRFEDKLKQNQITKILMTSGLLNQFVDQNIEIFSDLKTLFVGGDVLSPKHINKLRNANKELKVINAYGPTESTVIATCLEIDKDYEKNIPIGKPISNTQIYIMDKYNNVQQIGEPGELCIAGDGLARGYLNRPELTKEKFVVSPFVSNSKMYRTGDLARWLPDGNIEFIGRIDHQVKIRGFRIELGEIENQLLKYDGVKEAVVIDKVNSKGNKYLCGYVVSDKEIEVSDLRSYLSKELPEYMIPSHFMRLDKLPLTPNGKVDKKALPEFEGVINTGIEFKAPTNETEEKLAEIWRTILSVERIGIHDNFFDLGGHSLLAMKVVTRAVPYDWNITVQDLFNFPTIQRLASKINGSLKKIYLTEKADLDIVTRELKESYEEIAVSGGKINFENILLTGATGYLGIHILQDLLLSTSANVYCLIRGENQSLAKTRLVQLLDTYFDGKYNHWLDKRIYVIKGDLTVNQFGLLEKEYLSLGEKVNTIIHPAAIVKHFGNYSDFEQVNVLGTKEVIDFALKYGVRLNHISTMSVSGSLVKGEKDVIFTENDFYVGQNYADNVYVKSKFEAENLVFKAMNEGLDATIYRVGNLTGRYRDGHFQTNIGENAFYNLIKSIVELKSVSSEMSNLLIEFTPIDMCSRVIVELMKTKESVGRVFHVYNQNQVKIVALLLILAEMGLDIDVIDDLSIDEYVKTFAKDQDKLEKLQGLMHRYQFKVDQGLEYRAGVTIDSTITIEYLKQIGFEWPMIDQEYLAKVLEYMRKVNFI
ncbi:MAG: amino acid adenylation domain-containing protein [Halanaerobiales bacterium]|nr:amino acid adenylation domain-containing protein [Halanaerobiales bacterium]